MITFIDYHDRKSSPFNFKFSFLNSPVVLAGWGLLLHVLAHGLLAEY